METDGSAATYPVIFDVSFFISKKKKRINFRIQKPLKIDEDKFYVVSLLWKEIELYKGLGDDLNGLRWYGGSFQHDSHDLAEVKCENGVVFTFENDWPKCVQPTATKVSRGQIPKILFY